MAQIQVDYTRQLEPLLEVNRNWAAHLD